MNARIRRLWHVHSWSSWRYTEDRAAMVRECHCGATDAHPACQPGEAR